MTTPTKAWPPVNAHTIEGTEAHAHPSHAIRAYTAATNEDIFSPQYAVRRSCVSSRIFTLSLVCTLLVPCLPFNNNKMTLSLNNNKGKIIMF